jgi:hypothetical protein
MAKALAGLALGLTLYAPALLHPAFPVFASLVSAAHAASAKSDPTWDQLTPQQREILAPIQSEWAGLDPARKRKWLGVAKRYPTMTQKEQARLQAKMREWAKLTPEERQAARAQYREFEQMRPRRKDWEEYQRQRQEEARKAEEARRAAETAQSAPDAEPLGPGPGAAGLRPQ